MNTVEGLFNAFYGLLTKIGIPCWIAIIVAGISAAVTGLVTFVVAWALKAVVILGAWFASAILQLFTKVRTENATAFNEVIAAGLGDLLGIEVSASSLPGGQGPGGVAQRMQAIGAALHDLLRGEFLTGGPISPEQGKANAEKFSGFAINFSTASAFFSTLTEAASVGFIKNVRDLGDNMVESIGLGRLQRLALEPLIKNAVQTPADRYYAALLRPKQMAEGQIVQAVRAGQMSEGDAQQQLAEMGYTDQAIGILLDQLSAKIGADLLQRLVRYNVLTPQQALDRLVNLGMTQEDATLELAAADESLGDAQVSSILSNLESARIGGFIGQEEFNANLGDLNLGTEQERLYRMRVAIQLEHPRTTITFAELKSGVVNGLVDFDYVDNWLNNKGYSQQDNTILTYEIIQALATAEAKTKAKQKKAAQLQAKGLPVPAALES